MISPNAFIYISLATGIIYVLFNLGLVRKLPHLADLFSLMLSVAAAYSGLELCYMVLEGSKNLGDFEAHKLIIVLGAVAVFWVALLTVLNLCKSVYVTSGFKKKESNPSPAQVSKNG